MSKITGSEVKKKSTYLASLASSNVRAAGESVCGSVSAEYFWSVEGLQIFLRQKVAHLNMELFNTKLFKSFG